MATPVLKEFCGKNLRLCEYHWFRIAGKNLNTGASTTKYQPTTYLPTPQKFLMCAKEMPPDICARYRGPREDPKRTEPLTPETP